MPSFQPVVKWSGSKRTQAFTIISRFPKTFNTYYEPFIGGGSVLYALHPQKAVCGDICSPLIALWNKIKDSPAWLAEEYRLRWEKLQQEGPPYFYQIREQFNESFSAENLLFLSRTCVNGLIRFNSKGQFNSSFHLTRPGIHPDKLKDILEDWSAKIKPASFYAKDYRELLETAKAGDLIYLDPPYFHTTSQYYGKIDFEKFLSCLEELNRKGVFYVLSFDGVRGDESYIVEIPKELYKTHELINSGQSSFNRLQDKKKTVVQESLYLNFEP